MSDPIQPHRNALLETLSMADFARLSMYLESTRLQRDQVLYESHVPQRFVYFPTHSVVSLQCVLREGTSDEIAIVGNEGVVGVALVMDVDSASYRAVVRQSGHAWRIRGDHLRHEFHRVDTLQRGMLRYSQALLTQIAQTAVCNRHHSVDQRLCRWLLLSLDRLLSNEVNMTQEQIANMLGVRREGITEAAGKLQRAGTIHYSRGRIEVLDRCQLERAACECYEVVRRECARLLPPTPVRIMRTEAMAAASVHPSPNEPLLQAGA